MSEFWGLEFRSSSSHSQHLVDFLLELPLTLPKDSLSLFRRPRIPSGQSNSTRPKAWNVQIVVEYIRVLTLNTFFLHDCRFLIVKSASKPTYLCSPAHDRYPTTITNALHPPQDAVLSPLGSPRPGCGRCPFLVAGEH